MLKVQLSLTRKEIRNGRYEKQEETRDNRKIIQDVDKYYLTKEEDKLARLNRTLFYRVQNFLQFCILPSLNFIFE